MQEHDLEKLQAWAVDALSEYHLDLALGGEPVYPECAQIALDLIRMYEAAVAHNEMLLARLKKQAKEMEAIGAGGVDRRSLMGWRP